MKHLQFTEMIDKEVYDVITALRGPDCQMLDRALKWVITGRIRFYVLPKCLGRFVQRRDIRADSSWAKAHRDWDKAIEAGVPCHSLVHWADHADAALEAIRKLCLADACDVVRRDEIYIMFDLLNAACTALSPCRPCADPGRVAEAAQFVHTQLTRLQAITDGLAQSQEVTNE